MIQYNKFRYSSCVTIVQNGFLKICRDFQSSYFTPKDLCKYQHGFVVVVVVVVVVGVVVEAVMATPVCLCRRTDKRCRRCDRWTSKPDCSRRRQVLTDIHFSLRKEKKRFLFLQFSFQHYSSGNFQLRLLLLQFESSRGKLCITGKGEIILPSSKVMFLIGV